jgi:hypothetical protein
MFGPRPEQNMEEKAVKIKYTVPYEWGRFRLSDEAVQAYGIAPLTEEYIRGDSPAALPIGSPFTHVTDITLLGPGEADTLSDHFKEIIEQTPGGLDLLIGGHVKKKDTQIWLALNMDREQLSDSMISGLATQAHIESEQVDQYVADIQGVPITESIRHHSPQYLLQYICGGLQTALVELHEQRMKESVDRIIVGRTSIFGIGAVAVGGLMLSAETISHSVAPESMALTGAVMAFYLALGRQKLKEELQAMRRAEPQIQIQSHIVVDRMVGEINRTFSPQYFSRTLDQMMQDTTDDEPE